MDLEKLEPVFLIIEGGSNPPSAFESAGYTLEEYRSLALSFLPEHDAFKARLRQAIARAQVAAEQRVYEKKPLEWLTKGPGRDGWGDRVEHEVVLQTTSDLSKLTAEELASYEAILRKIAASESSE